MLHEVENSHTTLCKVMLSEVENLHTTRYKVMLHEVEKSHTPQKCNKKGSLYTKYLDT